MNFLSRIGNSCIVLCSATQPTFEKTDYPLLLDENSSMTGDYADDFRKLKRSRIVPLRNLDGYSYEEAAAFCREKLREAGSILIIVNTKSAALRLYDLMSDLDSEETRVIHLSTSMCPARRRKTIAEIRDRLNIGKKVLCISTQLVEAGVDISFPCVIRSSAGLDSAAQAAGRCNRNNEMNRCCDTYLINLKEENTGKLVDIRSGQNTTREIIRNPAYTDYLAVDTMSAYFEKYYAEQELDHRLSYYTEDLGIKTTIVDLLSSDSVRWSIHHAGDKKGNWHSQAFRTAGQKFHVIDQNTVPVVVPDCEEAREIICRLRLGYHDDDPILLLRKAQQYMIEIYENTERILVEKHALELLPCNIYILKEEYYDEKTGVRLDGRPMDLLMF